MAPVPPSLLWEWVSAKRTGGVPIASDWLALLLLELDLSQERRHERLCFFQRGLSALSKALQVLLGLVLYGGLSPSWGPHRHPSPDCCFSEPLRSHPLPSGPAQSS